MILPERPHGGFRTILADPAWRFANWSAAGEKKNPVAHYSCMPLADMMALPVEPLAADNAALFMWATFPMLPEALELMRAWGFAYKTGGAWAKQSTTGRRWSFGTGYIFRSAAELLIVGTRGKPAWTSKAERNLWVAPVREHSRKPDCVHDMIERLAIGPRLELFGRQSRPGWTVCGDEATKFDGEGVGTPTRHRPAPPVTSLEALGPRETLSVRTTSVQEIAGRVLRRKRRRMEAQPREAP